MKAQKPSSSQDERFLLQLAQGDENALRQLMDKYIDPLCNYVIQITGSKDYSQEVVADVFLNLWRIRTNIQVHSSLRAYLYRACKNRAFDLLDKESKHQSQSASELSSQKDETTPEAMLNLKELNWQIDALIRKMPQQKQLVFRLSRIDGLKYSEIAEVLSISVNTVQNHMVEAVKFMASHKSDIK